MVQILPVIIRLWPTIMGTLLIFAGIIISFLYVKMRAKMTDTIAQYPSLYEFGPTKWVFRTSNPRMIMIVVGAFLLGLSPFLKNF